MSVRSILLCQNTRIATRFNQLRKQYCSHYVTTPIFYVNSAPHIGHVYTVVLADAINRYEQIKLDTKKTLFSAGTDEHGLKIQTAAQDANQDIQKHCDINAKKFKDLFDSHELTITDFIRTTDSKHKIAVQSLWKQLVDLHLIYKASYSGWYCTSDETFVPESQVKTELADIGQTRRVNQEGKMVFWTEEENYIFKFSLFHDQVVDWLETVKPIKPHKFNDLAISMMKNLDFSDLSVSRPKNRVTWGIEVPGDASQTVYVWFDALVNYLTVAGYPCAYGELRRWPIDCQVFGKDILKFHGIIWPSLLLALKLPLPKRLVCHSHWLVGTQKMSKSLGNSIDPNLEADVLTTEGLRYYLLRAGTPHSDTSYSREQAVQRANSELANTYGNLLARACSSKINPSQTIPINLSDKPDMVGILDLKKRLDECSQLCSAFYNDGDFYKGINEILSILRQANQTYQTAQPWILVKNMGERYHDIQAITFETLRICSILLQPIVPRMSRIVLDKLNVSDRAWKDTKLRLNALEFDGTNESLRINSNHCGPVFPRVGKN